MVITTQVVQNPAYRPSDAFYLSSRPASVAKREPGPIFVPRASYSVSDIHSFDVW